MLSRLFMRRATTPPRFAVGLFFGLFVVFSLIALTRPITGLAGLGAITILAAALVELNAQRIWQEYRKAYKKQRGLAGLWSEPKQIYYRINVVIIWPLIAVLGVLCLWASYVMTEMQ